MSSQVTNHAGGGVVVIVQHVLENVGEALGLVAAPGLRQRLDVRGFDLGQSFRLFQLDQAFALRPGVALDLAGGRVGFFLLVSLGLLVQVGVTLFQARPFGLALEEAEVAAGAGAPLVILGQADAGIV